MTIEKRTRPYELLVRWGPAGLQGAHVQFIDEIVEDDLILQARPGDVIPVSLAGDAGFPVADILSTAQADAIGTATAKMAECDALQEQLRTTTTELQDATGALAVLQEQYDQTCAALSAARAQIATLTGAP